MIEKISCSTKRSVEEILYILSNKSQYYKTFTIKKRNGDKRLIHQPSKEILELQNYVRNNVLNSYSVSKYSKAYEKKCSLFKAVKEHRKSNHYLTLDIKSFFYSITYNHFYELLDKKYNTSDIKILWQIVSYNDMLPVGAATSPFIANRIMFNLDKQIKKSCSKLKYSRYADDLTLSSKKRIENTTILTIQSILHTKKFIINEDKTKFIGKNQSQKILGLVLNQNKIAIGLKKRKFIKSKVYDYLKHQKGTLAQVKGLISFANTYEPDFVKKMAIKYQNIGFNRIWN